MTNAVSLAQYGSTGVSQGFKNRIINGACVISQRGASPTITGGGDYSIDRFYNYYSGPVYTSVQSTTAPAGFVNSLKLTVTTPSASPTYSFFGQKIEGFNVADLGFGGVNAKTVTLSFWVQSSVAGVYSFSLTNGNGDRAYPQTYTITSANTWQQITATVAGDTTGTWATDNSAGINIRFNMGSPSGRLGTSGSWQAGNYDGATGSTGSSTWANTNGATFYITGVQLEVGSTATSFDYRPYGTELGLCQRYYAKISSTVSNGAVGSGLSRSSTATNVYIKLPVSMRTIPTVSYNTAYINYASDVYRAVDGNSGVQGGTDAINYFPNSSTATIGGNGFAVILAIGSGGYVDFSAEL